MEVSFLAAKQNKQEHPDVFSKRERERKREGGRVKIWGERQQKKTKTKPVFL